MRFELGDTLFYADPRVNGMDLTILPRSSRVTEIRTNSEGTTYVVGDVQGPETMFHRTKEGAMLDAALALELIARGLRERAGAPPRAEAAKLARAAGWTRRYANRPFDGRADWYNQDGRIVVTNYLSLATQGDWIVCGLWEEGLGGRDGTYECRHVARSEEDALAWALEHPI